MSDNHKIKKVHLARKAIVYIRQSTNKQVCCNLESQNIQYSLTERARELGWHDIEVIDDDLGQSAGLASQRRGFERMLSLVTLGSSGIIFSSEASRLSRTDTNWCRLLEVCGIFDTLIGDTASIYNVNNIDDQMILGIKGMISVVELSTLRQRMLRGQEEKAKRGELQKLLSPGYIHDLDGKIVKDPDQRVQAAINLMFRKYKEINSIRQLMKWFHEEEIELPYNQFSGKGRGRRTIGWKLPTRSFLANIFHNPCYAGAYVYGRRTTEIVCQEGEIVKRTTRFLPLEEIKVLLHNHHECYISWEEFEENQKRMRSNCLNISSDDRGGAIRSGQGLLVGLLRCGHCGRKLYVYYSGKNKTGARYICKGDYDSGGSYCISFGGATVDKQFGKELLNIFSPLTCEASLKSIDELERECNEKKSILEKQLQQLEYEARRAFEQYNEVDPRNRLVAAELECRWNEKLVKVEKLKDEVSSLVPLSVRLSDADRAKIFSLGDRFGELWQDQSCPTELKKKLIRIIVEELIVTLDDEKKMLRFIIHWKGGTHTNFEMEKPKSPFGKKTSVEDLEIIRKMTVRYSDDEIACVLSKLGRRTSKGNRWSSSRVKNIRSRYKIKRIPRDRDTSKIFTQGKAAQYLGVNVKIIEKLSQKGFLPYQQIVPYAPWEITKEDLDQEIIRLIIDNLKKSGKLELRTFSSSGQHNLFSRTDVDTTI